MNFQWLAKILGSLGSLVRQMLPGLRLADVRAIIEHASQYDVSSLSFRGLSLTFGVTPSQVDISRTGSDPSPADLQKAREDLARRKVAEEDAKKLSEIEARDFELEELKLNDPAEFERRMINGEVE